MQAQPHSGGSSCNSGHITIKSRKVLEQDGNELEGQRDCNKHTATNILLMQEYSKADPVLFPTCCIIVYLLVPIRPSLFWFIVICLLGFSLIYLLFVLTIRTLVALFAAAVAPLVDVAAPGGRRSRSGSKSKS
jgi:hypothetical protein